MCFTDFVQRPEDRDMIGTYYIALILFFVSVHIILIAVTVLKKLKLKGKSFYNKCMNSGLQ